MTLRPISFVASLAFLAGCALAYQYGDYQDQGASTGGAGTTTSSSSSTGIGGATTSSSSSGSSSSTTSSTSSSSTSSSSTSSTGSSSSSTGAGGGATSSSTSSSTSSGAMCAPACTPGPCEVTSTCVSGSCVPTFKAAGTPAAASVQVAGDCHTTYCNGIGGQNVLVDNSDTPGPTPCAHFACNGGVPSPVVSPDGSSCNDGNPGSCFGGTCKHCNNAGTCTDVGGGHCYCGVNGTCGECPLTASCMQDGDCQTGRCEPVTKTCLYCTPGCGPSNCCFVINNMNACQPCL